MLLLWGITCIFFDSSCTKSNSQLSNALKEAGENRKELEKVLDHYKSEPEKLSAAKFLIENMPAHYSYEGNDIHKYYAIAQQVCDILKLF